MTDSRVVVTSQRLDEDDILRQTVRRCLGLEAG